MAGRASNLLERVRVERRAAVPLGDGSGNVEGDWQRIGPPILRAQVNELPASSPRSAETIEAAKLQGHATCIVTVRASIFTRSITTDDRIIHIAFGGVERVLNVRYAPQVGRTDFLALLCEDNQAT